MDIFSEKGYLAIYSKWQNRQEAEFLASLGEKLGQMRWAQYGMTFNSDGCLGNHGIGEPTWYISFVWGEK